MKWSYITWIPAVLVMVMIFRFSMANAEESAGLSGGITYDIVQMADRICHLEMTQEQKLQWEERIHVPIRKCAHFVEYFVLGVCLAFHFWMCGYGRKQIIIMTTIIAGLYACSDEIHQVFVPGRGPGVKDVLLDTVAGLTGSALFQGCLYLIGKWRYNKE